MPDSVSITATCPFKLKLCAQRAQGRFPVLCAAMAFFLEVRCNFCTHACGGCLTKEDCIVASTKIYSQDAPSGCNAFLARVS